MFFSETLILMIEAKPNRIIDLMVFLMHMQTLFLKLTSISISSLMIKRWLSQLSTYNFSVLNWMQINFANIHFNCFSH